MAITITTADIKRKAMIDAAETAYDSAIAALIAEVQPAVEHSIEDCHIEDTSNAGLQATLKLGLLEIVTGEFLEQLRREMGATEEVSIAGVSLGASTVRGADLVQQGSERLAPYLKGVLPHMGGSSALSNTLDSVLEFADGEVC